MNSLYQINPHPLRATYDLALQVAGKATSFAYSFASPFASSFSKSIVGKILLHLAKENIAEGVGSSTLAALAGKVAGYVAPKILRSPSLGCGLAIGGGAFVGHFLKGKSEADNEGRGYLSIAKTAALTAVVAGSLLYTLPSSLNIIEEAIGEEMAAVVGENLGAVVGGIVGGFTAIHWLGSEEVLWNSQQWMRSYAAKSCLCAAAFMLIDLWREPSSIIDSTIDSTIASTIASSLVSQTGRFLTDQMIGSLVYNSLDIVELLINIKRGRALDGLLPSQIEMEDLFLSAPFSEKEEGQTTCGAHFIEQKAEKLELLSNGQSQTFKEEVKREPLFEPSLQNGAKKNLNGLLTCAIKGFNDYMQSIAQSEAIQHAQSQFDRLFYVWQREEESVWFKNNRLEDLRVARMHLIAAIHSFFAEQGARQEEKGANAFGEAFLSPVSFERQSCRKIVAYLLKQGLQNIEKKIIGFSLTADEQELYFQELFAIHLPFIYPLIDLRLSSDCIQKEEDIRDFYRNSARLVAGHYGARISQKLSQKLGQGIAHFSLSVLEKQLATSQLS